MRSKGPFDKLNSAKELISRYRFQIDEAQNGDQQGRDYLVEEFDDIFQDLRERKLDVFSWSYQLIIHILWKYNMSHIIYDHNMKNVYQNMFR